MHSLLPDAGMIVGWLVLFAGIALFLAYRRFSLALSTGALLLLLAAYWILGAAPFWWKTLISIPFALLLLLNLRPLRIRLVDAAVHEKVSQAAAAHVGHGARGAGCGNGVVGRRTFHRGPGLAEAHVGKNTGAHARRTGVSRRTLRRAVRHAR